MAVEHAEAAAEAAHETGGFLTESGFLADTHNWVLISTIVFAYFFLKFAKNLIVGALDARTERIRNELAEAERLRTEAQELLAQYQRKHRDAMKDAEEIIEHARETAARLTEEAKEDLETTMKRREAALEEKISRAEASAMQEIRERASVLAIEAAEKLILEKLSQKDGHAKLIDESISQMDGKFH